MTHNLPWHWISVSIGHFPRQSHCCISFPSTFWYPSLHWYSHFEFEQFLISAPGGFRGSWHFVEAHCLPDPIKPDAHEHLNEPGRFIQRPPFYISKKKCIWSYSLTFPQENARVESKAKSDLDQFQFRWLKIRLAR